MAHDLDQQKIGMTIVPVMDLFVRRWSPRAFTSAPVELDKLKAIFSAGQWAASSANEQPWRFVVGHSGDHVWEQIFSSLHLPNQAWAKAAPVLFASFARKTFSPGGRFEGLPNHAAQHDVGAASAQIALQATALGLHSHAMGGFDAEKLVASLQIPSEFEPMACWALGYRGDASLLNEPFAEIELHPRSRKPLHEWVFREWGTAAF